jgi:hypothetical protein
MPTSKLERMSLLHLPPSPNSNDLPTARKVERYGTDESLEDEEQNGLLAISGPHPTTKGLQKRDRIVKMVLVGTAMLALVLGLALHYYLTGGDGAPSTSYVPGSDATPTSHVHHRTDDLRQPMGRFSTQHPVRDLGLTEHVRDKSSSPYRVLTHSNEHRQHYPTNAWYQNMLLVPDEPDLVHRVYSIPYVLDVVGPIPGIRVHPNHIEASTSVIQLSIIEAYGLTVGATKAISQTTSGSKGGSDAQEDIVNHRYVVENTTPLGLTLAWVSSAP